MALISLNPATNKVIKKHYVHKDPEIKKILESALKSQKYWSRLELGKRLEPVLQMSSYLKDNYKPQSVKAGNDDIFKIITSGSHE